MATKRFSGPKPKAGASDRLAERIAGGIIALQRRVASRLNGLASRMGTASVKILLSALLLAFAGYCGYLVLGVFI